MSFKLCVLLIICCAMTRLWGAFQDFVIENKKDLERFGVSNVDMMYDDDDDLLDDEYYDGNSFAIRSSCKHYEDVNFAEDGKIGLPIYDSQIDKEILYEIIRQLANQPYTPELKNYLAEGNEIEIHNEDL